jgi:hypothetical protein
MRAAGVNPAGEAKSAFKLRVRPGKYRVTAAYRGNATFLGSTGHASLLLKR